MPATLIATKRQTRRSKPAGCSAKKREEPRRGNSAPGHTVRTQRHHGENQCDDARLRRVHPSCGAGVANRGPISVAEHRNCITTFRDGYERRSQLARHRECGTHRRTCDREFDGEGGRVSAAIRSVLHHRVSGNQSGSKWERPQPQGKKTYGEKQRRGCREASGAFPSAA